MFLLSSARLPFVLATALFTLPKLIAGHYASSIADNPAYCEPVNIKWGNETGAISLSVVNYDYNAKIASDVFSAPVFRNLLTNYTGGDNYNWTVDVPAGSRIAMVYRWNDSSSDMAMGMGTVAVTHKVCNLVLPYNASSVQSGAMPRLIPFWVGTDQESAFSATVVSVLGMSVASGFALLSM